MNVNVNVNEDVTVTVNDGDSEDVLGDDTNADESASLSVSALRTGSTEGNGTGSTLGSALTGTYGQLTLNANGSYTYVTNQSAADDLDAGDTATDAFNYTVSDGTATDTATLTFTITGVNDTPVGVNDTDYINEEETLTVSNGGAAVSGTVSGSNTGTLYQTTRTWMTALPYLFPAAWSRAGPVIPRLLDQRWWARMVLLP